MNSQIVVLLLCFLVVFCSVSPSLSQKIVFFRECVCLFVFSKRFYEAVQKSKNRAVAFVISVFFFILSRAFFLFKGVAVEA